MRDKTFLVSCLAAGMAMGAATLPSLASAQATVWIRTAPPPLRQEIVPPPRAGYVWAPGHWEWSGRRHIWHQGVWMKARRGYVYVPPIWVEHDGRWEYHRGAWARGDADHDGVPNAVDKRPNNPNRR